MLRAFSRRRAEIEAELLRRGESSAAAARMATLSTRQRKDYGVVPEQLVELWRARAARLGFDRAALRAVLGVARARGSALVDWERAFARLAAPTGLTHRRSTFAPRDVIQALCEAVPLGANVSGSGWPSMSSTTGRSRLVNRPAIAKSPSRNRNDTGGEVGLVATT